ncbi:MAG: hypothetical protein ACLTBF_06405 [Christensenellales bacterium]
MADFLCAACLCLSGCAAGSGGGDKPALPQPEQTAGRAPGKSAAQLVPERLEKNESGVPMLKVYDVKNEKLETLSVEDYLPAVLAGEWRATGRWRRSRHRRFWRAHSCCNSSPKRNPCTTARISPPTSKKRRRMTRRA